MECGQNVLFVTFVVMTVDQEVARGGDPLERQKQGNHAFRKSGTLTLICGKNRSHHYINDEVLETEKREWNS